METIAITGGGSGLGRALACQYAQAGNTVYLLGRDEEKLLMVQNEINSNSSNSGLAEVVACDISEPASVQLAWEQLNQLDLLINNAAIGTFGPVADYSVEQIDQLIDINVKGTILMTQYALPLLKERKGRIINIVSTAGLRGKAHESIYCASKFAVKGFTESLQKEWADTDLSITAAYMGGMNTPFWKETNHVKDPTILKGAQVVAEQIYKEDDGRREIIIDG